MKRNYDLLGVYTLIGVYLVCVVFGLWQVFQAR